MFCVGFSSRVVKYIRMRYVIQRMESVIVFDENLNLYKIHCTHRIDDELIGLVQQHGWRIAVDGHGQVYALIDAPNTRDVMNTLCNMFNCELR
jgi:hypothetical protein